MRPGHGREQVSGRHEAGPGTLIEQAARSLAASGIRARVTVAGDPFWGDVLRWGTVTGVRGGRITFAGDLHDCTGILERVQSVGVEHVRHIGDARVPLRY